MRNMKYDKPMVKYPNMPNRLTGPANTMPGRNYPGMDVKYGTRPTDAPPAPYWYLQKQPEEPLRVRAMKKAFEQPARKARHPFQAYKGC